MTERISLEDLARRTGEPLDRLRQWRQAGLIGGEGEGFSLEDVERVYMVQLFLRRGIGLEAIAKANDEHGFLHRYLDVVFPRGVGRTCSLAEAAEQSGMNVDIVRRIIEASGLTDEGDTLTEDDVAMLQRAGRSVDAGFPLEALLQVLRVYADTLSRAAEAGTRTFHAYVHERLTAAGVPAEELERAIGDQALPLVEPTIIYFFRKGQAKASREDIVLHVAEAAGLLPPAEVPGQMKRAVAFVDLSSFTPMTAEMGDLKAAEVLQQFSQLVRESAARSDGRVVKQIGDAFMLVFPQAASAVACLLEIERRVAVETQFPAVRGGIACGSVLYREGDYVGSLVNLASRLAGEADRHQVLITSDVRKGAAGLPDVEFSPLGRRRLKGITDDIELFEARPADSAPGAKVIDPVCGIELGAGEVAVSLTLDGVAHSFCSEDCLRKFVGSPERYTQRPSL